VTLRIRKFQNGRKLSWPSAYWQNQSFRLIATCWLAAALAVRVFGQGTPPELTLDDCVNLARATPSSVRLARQQAEIARYGITQARAGFLPQFSVGSGFIYNSPLLYDRNAFSFIPLNAIREYTALPTAALELDTSGRLRAELDRARADRDAAAANLSLSERDLRHAVAVSYYHVLLARKLAEATRANLIEARSFEDRVRRLVESGEASQADLVKASSQTIMLDQTQQALELDARLANHDLASFWTTDVDATLGLVDVMGQPPRPPETSPEPSPFLRRAEFRLFDAEKSGFLADARRARADLLPQASIIFQYGIDAQRVSIDNRGYAAFLRLNIPVFDWFRARSASQQFQTRAQQIETTRQITERTFSREYQDALARVQLIYAQIATTDAQVKLSEENLRLSRVRYEGGEGPALDVVLAQAQLVQARSNFYLVRANYLVALTDLEVARGQ
jgi:outer membrane protein TolC